MSSYLWLLYTTLYITYMYIGWIDQNGLKGFLRYRGSNEKNKGEEEGDLGG